MSNDSSIIDAFNHMQAPLLILDQFGTIKHCNAACDRLFGYENGTLCGQAIFSILPIKSMAELDALIEPPSINAVVKGMTAQTQHGEPIILAMNLTAWCNAPGPLQYALAFTDIGDDFKARRAFKSELQRANNAIKGARLGVFEYNTIDQSVIVSDIWREITELDAPISDVQAEWRARIHPDDLEATLERVQMCIDNKCERAKGDHRYLAKDGSHWRWIQADVSVGKRDKTGRVTHVIGSVVDITERKEIEQSLRVSQEQFRSAFEDSSMAKAIVSLDGKNLRVNRALCNLVARSQSELLEMKFQSILHADDRSNRLFTQLGGSDPRDWQTEKRITRADGGIIWVLLSAGVVNDDAGKPERFIVQIADVTEQRRLIEMKREFVSTVSHELRTPLTSVLGALALLSSMDDEPFSDGAQRLLYIAQENGKRLNALINDILDFEKFSASRMQFEHQDHKIIGLIEESALMNMPAAEKFNVKFSIECPDRTLTAFIDAKRFQQVMTNLLSNAVKFANADTIVLIQVEKQDAFVKVSVRNTGGGVPVEFQADIFEPFAQAASSDTRSRGGTGLGLNITKQIVEQMGGQIGFENKPAGCTTFWFTVPIDAPE